MIDLCWLVQSASDPPGDDEWLAWREKAFLDSLNFPRRREDWRLGRWTAKTALARSLPPAERPEQLSEIEIRAAEDGAPEAFLAGRPAPLTLSLSHRAGLALCTLAPAGALVGCDLEVVEPRSELFVEDFFTVREQEMLAEAPPAERALLDNLVWSAKESALKALRTGLKLDTRRVEVSLPGLPEEGGWQRLAVRHAGTGRLFQGWWRRRGRHLLTVVAEPAPRPPAELAAGNLD